MARRVQLGSGRIVEFDDNYTDDMIRQYLLSTYDADEITGGSSAFRGGVDLAARTGATFLETLGGAADIAAADEAAPVAPSDTNVGRIERSLRDVPVLGSILNRNARAAEVGENALASLGKGAAGLIREYGPESAAPLAAAVDIGASEVQREQLRRRQEENAARAERGELSLEHETGGTFAQAFADQARSMARDARGAQSDESKVEQMQLSSAFDEGIDKGFGYALTNPFDTFTAIAPEVGAFLLGGGILGRTAKTLGAADELAAMLSIQSQGAAAAEMNASGAASTVRDLSDERIAELPMGRELIANGMTVAEAREEMARRAYDATIGISAPLNAALMGATQKLNLNPVETAVAGGKGFGSRVAAMEGATGRLARGATGAAAEGAGEFVEESADQLGQNLGEIAGGARRGKDVLEGTATAGAMGLLAGSAMGGGLGLMTAPQVAKQRTDVPTDTRAPAEQGEADVRAIYQAAVRGEEIPLPARADTAQAEPEAPTAAPATTTATPAAAEVETPATRGLMAEPADDLEAQLQAAGAAPNVQLGNDAASAAFRQQQAAEQLRAPAPATPAPAGRQSRPPPQPTTTPRNLTADDFNAVAPAQTGYASGVRRLELGEEAKPYLKQNIDTLPMPTPEQLPVDSSLRYFSPDSADRTVPMSALIPSKQDEAGNAAVKRMAATASGVIDRRAAIDVEDNGDGTYTIVDGNGSYNAALKIGLQDMPVRIVKAPEGKEPWRENRGLLTPEQDAQLLAAYEQAQREAPLYKTVVNKLAKQFGADHVVAPLKGRTRAEQKIRDDYKGDVSKIADLLRGTLKFDNPQQAINAANKLRSMFTVVKDKDGLSPGTADKGFGYRDINLVVRLPGGSMAEIQLMTQAMSKAKSEAHSLYEITRAVDARIENGTATAEDLKKWRDAAAAQLKAYGEANALDSAATNAALETGDQESVLRQSDALVPESDSAAPPENRTALVGGSERSTNASTSESLRSMNTTEPPAGGMVTPANTSATGQSPAPVDGPIVRAVRAVMQALGLKDDAIVIARSPAEVFGSDGMRALKLDAKTEGYYYNGQAYVFTDNVVSPARAIWVALHEHSGHHGLATLLGDRFVSVMNFAGSNPMVKAIADDLRAEAEAEAEAGVEGARKTTDPNLFIEEALVELQAAVITGDFSEIYSRYPSTAGVKSQSAPGLIQRVINAIKAALGKAGAPKMTDAEVAELLRGARRAAREQQTGTAEAAPTAGRQSRAVQRSTAYMLSDLDAAKKELGLKAVGANTTRAVGEAFNKWAAKKFGKVDVADRSEQAIEKIAVAMADEVASQVESTGSETGTGLGWYSNNYPNAVKRLAVRFPELGNDEAAQNAFTMILAITSNGEKVKRNLEMAVEMYSAFRDGRSLTEAMPGTRRAEALEENVAVIDELISRFGVNGVKDHLLEELTVKEINAELRARGEKPSGAYTADMRLPRAALYFGPKLGAFYANLAGADGYLTMDLWWSRSFNRYRANMLPQPTESGMAALREMLSLPESATIEQLVESARPHWESYKKKGYKNGTDLEKKANTFYKAAVLELNEAPESATDRRFMYEVAKSAQKKLSSQGKNLSLADIQAALWYYEKRLYAGLTGRKTDDIGYEEAINEWAVEGDRPTRSVARSDRPGGGEQQPAGEGGQAGPDVRGRAERGQPRAGRNAPSQDAGTEPQPAFQGRLPGAPVVRGFDGPDPRLVSVAEQYARDNGIELRRQAEYVKVDPERAKRIADAYEAMEHAPQDPRVRAAYDDLIAQTTAQYRALERAGYRFWFIDIASDAGKEYTSSPWNAMRDIRANQSMGVFPTEEGFGTDVAGFDPTGNPLLRDTGIRWPLGGPDGELRPVLANDLFRAVHDAFGHGLEGSGFRAVGEENAWQAHVRLFTGDAVAAITTETRGQNSWLNFGPFGERNRTASAEKTVFAEQKTGLMPEWTWLEGRAGDMGDRNDADQSAGASSDGQPGVRRDDAGQGEGVPPVQAVQSRAFPADAPSFRQRKQQADAVSAQGIHYSGASGLTSLDGKFAGSGSAGAERRRFGMGQYGAGADPGDTARRLYFYVQEGDTAPRKEDVVAGNNRYAVNLTNLYDVEADPRGLREEAGTNVDLLEELVNDAGFDGLLLPPLPGIEGKTAILHGLKKKVPVVSAPLNGKQSRAPAKPQPGVPTPLYADRPVVDDGGLRQWAINAGLTDVLPAEEMHVTVAYSMAPVDVADVAPDESGIAARASGKAVQLRSALAMPVASMALQRGHRRYRDAGASHNYGDQYNPHISLKYDPTPEDIAKLEAAPRFTGTIKLGPERHDVLKPQGQPVGKQSRAPSTTAARINAKALRERKSQLASELTEQNVTVEQIKVWTNKARLLIGDVSASRDFAQEIADAKRELTPERRDALQGDREALKRYDEIRDMIGMLDANQRAVRAKAMEANRLLDKVERRTSTMSLTEREQLLNELGESLEKAEQAYIAAKAIADWRAKNDFNIVKAYRKRDEVLSYLASEGFQQGSTPWGTGNLLEKKDKALRKIRRLFQDRLIDLRDVQDQIESEIGRAIDDMQNVYRAENQMHGKTADAIQGFHEKMRDPLIETINQTGMSLAAVERYLWAKHARERNDKIAAIRPGVNDGSGMTNDEADAIIGSFTPEQMRKLEAVSRKVQEVRKFTLSTMVRSGQIDQRSADAMLNTYADYVPLRGKNEQYGDERIGQGRGTGQGISAGGTGIVRALGRKTPPKNILAELVGDAERSIVQAQKAEVGRALLRMALSYPNPEIWEVQPVDLKPTFNEATGEVYLAVTSTSQQDAESVVVKHNGKPYRVMIKHPQLMDALRNTGVAGSEWMVRWFGMVNRWLSAVFTRFNPGFVPINLMRDLTLGLTGIAAELGAGSAGKIAGLYSGSFGASYRQSRLQRGDASVPDSQKSMDDWAREAAEAGMKSGWTALDDMDTLQRDIENSMRGVGLIAKTGVVGIDAASTYAKMVKDGVIAGFDWVDSVNDGVENGLRLATYIHLRRDKGWSKAKAAEYAKELTVNFNRKGMAGSLINSLYLFYNAAVQGSRRTIKIMKHPKTMATLGAIGASQFLLASTLGMAKFGDDEDDETLWEKIPDHVKRRSFVIPSGFGDDGSARYIAIPMPFGFNAVPAVAGYAANYANPRWVAKQGGPMALAGNAIGYTTSTVIDALSPIAVGEDYAMWPTLVQMGMQLASNRDSLGRSIGVSDAFARYDMPRSEMYKPGTFVGYVWAARALNRIGLGDQYTPPRVITGMLDVSPNDLEFLAGQLLGGPGNIINQTWRMGAMAVAGEEIKASDIPIVRTIVGEQRVETSEVRTFYDNKDDIERNLDRLRDAFVDGGVEGFEAKREELGPMYADVNLKIRKETTENGFRGEPFVNERTGNPTFVADDGTLLDKYRDANKTLGDLNASLRRVYNDRSLTSAQKQAEIMRINREKGAAVAEVNRLTNYLSAMKAGE